MKKDVAEFLKHFEGQTVEREELEKVKFEQDELYSVEILEAIPFKGQYGESLCLIVNKDNEKVKTYLSGVEIDMFNKFNAENELPVNVQLMRTKRESQKNKGHLYNVLLIKTV